MPLEIIREDITKMRIDAIVTAANPRLESNGGVNGAIHRAAGKEMEEACRALGGCRTGEAKVTPGFLLPCRYVIHTVGPKWYGGLLGEKQKLADCYVACLALAKQHGVKSIAFPVISSGSYGVPPMTALHIAADAIRDFLMENDMHVYLVLFGSKTMRAGSQLYCNIREYIDDHYADAHIESRRSRMRNREMLSDSNMCLAPSAPCPPPAPCAAAPSFSLADALAMVDESFSCMVLRLIDERGWKDSECYKRANIDRKHFCKIRNDPHYKPKKSTALALAVALRLPLAQTHELLMKAGYALTHASKADIIVEYFIQHGIYDIDEINIALLDFDQQPLGF